MAFMPWNEIDVMTEKELFIALTQTGRFTSTELCADFGIRRPPEGVAPRRGQQLCFIQALISVFLVNFEGE